MTREPSRPPSNAIALEDLLERISAAVRSLRAVESDLRFIAPSGASSDPDELAELARSIYAERRLQQQLLPKALRGDGAWDLCLHLYAARHDGVRINTTAAIEATRMSPSTGLRIINTMAAHGLITRLQCPEKQNASLVELTDAAAYQLGALLATIAAQRSGPTKAHLA